MPTSEIKSSSIAGALLRHGNALARCSSRRLCLEIEQLLDNKKAEVQALSTFFLPFGLKKEALGFGSAATMSDVNRRIQRDTAAFEIAVRRGDEQNTHEH